MEIWLIYNVVLVSAVQQCEWIIYVYMCVCVCVWKWKSFSHVWLFGTPWTDNTGWDGWMASPTRGTWVWASSGSWWWTGKPGMLQSMGLQRVRHDWVTELNWKFVYAIVLLVVWIKNCSFSTDFLKTMHPITLLFENAFSWISMAVDYCSKL